jgi:hypothetical protein
LNGTHLLLAYADDINSMAENIDTTKKKTQALLVASKEAGLEVNQKKTKYMLMSHSQKIGQKHSIKIVNRSFEDVAKFKYLVATLKLHARTDYKQTKFGECLLPFGSESSVFPPAV